MRMTYAKVQLETSRAPNGTPARWWRRPWIVPLAFVVVVFLAFSLPPYLSLDASRSRVPPPPDFPLHYPLLVLHVICGSIALGCVVFQIWPWFRDHHWTAHRRIGRTYVLAGVLPGGLAGLVLAANTPFGPVIKVSSVMMALLWLGITTGSWALLSSLRCSHSRRRRSPAMRPGSFRSAQALLAGFPGLLRSCWLNGGWSEGRIRLSVTWRLDRPRRSKKVLAPFDRLRTHTCLAPRDFRQAESA